MIPERIRLSSARRAPGWFFGKWGSIADQALSDSQNKVGVISTVLLFRRTALDHYLSNFSSGCSRSVLMALASVFQRRELIEGRGQIDGSKDIAMIIAQLERSFSQRNRAVYRFHLIVRRRFVHVFWLTPSAP
jgi:hypothetical protein